MWTNLQYLEIPGIRETIADKTSVQHTKRGTVLKGHFGEVPNSKD